VPIVLAALVGSTLALATYRHERDLSFGRIRMSVDPGHRGALDIYVPVVDWGARFPAVRMPVRVRVDVRSVNRASIDRLASDGLGRFSGVRAEARSALESFIVQLLFVELTAALALSGLVALAVRGGRAPPLRTLLGVAAAASLACVFLTALLLPPRGPIDRPEYYAHGADIPVALRAVERATTASQTISEELNAQLAGLARLIVAPNDRPATGALPRVTIASDLHNNLLAIPALERAAAGTPVLFVGDLTSNGTPIEAQITRRIVRAGTRFVYVSGNHDSDFLAHRLARQGALVLTQRGRLLPSGRYGPLVVTVGGLRLVGYSDPFERRSRQDFKDRGEPQPTLAEQQAFAAWLRPLVGRIDAVLVHEPKLAQLAVQELRQLDLARPLAVIVGHTHRALVEASGGVVEFNGGTIGGGGTGNFEKDQPISLGVLTYGVSPRFDPIAADLVQLDPRTGLAKAERQPLDPFAPTAASP